MNPLIPGNGASPLPENEIELQELPGETPIAKGVSIVEGIVNELQYIGDIDAIRDSIQEGYKIEYGNIEPGDNATCTMEARITLTFTPPGCEERTVTFTKKVESNIPYNNGDLDLPTRRKLKMLVSTYTNSQVALIGKDTPERLALVNKINELGGSILKGYMVEHSEPPGLLEGHVLSLIVADKDPLPFSFEQFAYTQGAIPAAPPTKKNKWVVNLERELEAMTPEERADYIANEENQVTIKDYKRYLRGPIEENLQEAQKIGYSFFDIREEPGRFEMIKAGLKSMVLGVEIYEDWELRRDYQNHLHYVKEYNELSLQAEKYGNAQAKEKTDELEKHLQIDQLIIDNKLNEIETLFRSAEESMKKMQNIFGEDRDIAKEIKACVKLKTHLYKRLVIEEGNFRSVALALHEKEKSIPKTLPAITPNEVTNLINNEFNEFNEEALQNCVDLAKLDADIEKTRVIGEGIHNEKTALQQYEARENARIEKIRADCRERVARIDEQIGAIRNYNIDRSWPDTATAKCKELGYRILKEIKTTSRTLKVGAIKAQLWWGRFHKKRQGQIQIEQELHGTALNRANIAYQKMVERRETILSGISEEDKNVLMINIQRGQKVHNANNRVNQLATDADALREEIDVYNEECNNPYDGAKPEEHEKIEQDLKEKEKKLTAKIAKFNTEHESVNTFITNSQEKASVEIANLGEPLSEEELSDEELQAGADQKIKERQGRQVHEKIANLRGNFSSINTDLPQLETAPPRPEKPPEAAPPAPPVPGAPAPPPAPAAPPPPAAPPLPGSEAPPEDATPFPPNEPHPSEAQAVPSAPIESQLRRNRPDSRNPRVGKRPPLPPFTAEMKRSIRVKNQFIELKNQYLEKLNKKEPNNDDPTKMIQESSDFSKLSTLYNQIYIHKKIKIETFNQNVQQLETMIEKFKETYFSDDEDSDDDWE